MKANFNSIIEALAHASLFELSQLQAIIHNMLDDPLKVQAFKQRLKVGMQINYFCFAHQDLIAATILEIKKTKVLVLNCLDQQRFYIYIHHIQLDSADLNRGQHRALRGLNRYSLKVGEQVGFRSKHGQDLFGVIEKLNPKRALIQLGNGERWSVAYALLFSVTDGEYGLASHAPLCIEAEVVRREEI